MPQAARLELRSYPANPGAGNQSLLRVRTSLWCSAFLRSRFVADCLLFEEVEGILWFGNQLHCLFDWHVEVLRPYDPIFAQGLEVLFGWATRQNILGLALEAQGERSQGQEGRSLLRNAVEAYNNALRVSTSEQFPYQRAIVQNNLSRALQKLSTPSKTK